MLTLSSSVVAGVGAAEVAVFRERPIRRHGGEVVGWGVAFCLERDHTNSSVQ